MVIKITKYKKIFKDNDEKIFIQSFVKPQSLLHSLIREQLKTNVTKL